MYSPQDSHTLGQFKAIVDDAWDLLESVHVVLKFLRKMCPGPKCNRDGLILQLGHLEKDVQSPAGLTQQVKVEFQRHLVGTEGTIV